MFTRKFIAAAAVAGLGVLGLTACDPDNTTGHPVPVSRMADAASTYTAPTVRMPIAPPDPLSTDGMHLVPSEIAPGQYRVTPTGVIGGYYALCTDLDCQIGAGLLRNDFVTGTAYVTIPADGVVAIDLSDVRLELVKR